MRDFIKLGGILFIITAAVSFVLAIGNNATKERIDLLTKQAKAQAQVEVLEGVGDIDISTAKEFDVPDGASVTALTGFNSSDGKRYFAVAASPKGYGGEISIMVGVDEKLTVTGVSIIDNANETPGLGSRVGEPAFYEQFLGKTKNIGVIKNQPSGNQIEAVTGATISSRAVTEGVNDAIKAVEGVLGK